jgi:hypothetical protein
MSFNFKRFFNDYGIGAIIFLIILVFGFKYFSAYLSGKGKFGNELLTSGNMNPAYSNSPNQGPPISGTGPKPSEPLGQNETYSSVSGITGQTPPATSCANTNLQNPSELLPKDANSSWAQLNPSGKGELANINLLKAGYHIGIDTVGSSLRNPNLQIRSEFPNPQLDVSIWNKSTISPDFLRPPLEIGQGNQ